MCACICRHFKLYLRTNDQLFTEDFRAVIVDEDGRERSYPVNRHNYFSGHVVGNSVLPEVVCPDAIADRQRLTGVSCATGEENSRVQAHIDEHEFSAHILTNEAEYNIEVIWFYQQQMTHHVHKG